MIFKTAIIAALALALVAIATGKDIVRQRTLTLMGKRYEITRYTNDTLEVTREDGLRFTMDLKSGQSKLAVGTDAQLQDALAVLTKMAVDQIAGAGGSG